MRKNSIIALLFTCTASFAQETTPAFYDDILAFRNQDSLQVPPKNVILFVGSSSFTQWTDVQDYFPKHTIINRGFGGSTLLDVIRYSKEVILTYQPKQIVLYCGENDLASSDTVTAQMVLHRFKQLFKIIRKSDPAVPVAFVSLKPSPNRKHLWPKMEKANQLINAYLRTKMNTSFIDVYHKMFNSDGTVMNDIFIEDDLHMNAKGYAIWKKSIQPYLIQINHKK